MKSWSLDLGVADGPFPSAAIPDRAAIHPPRTAEILAGVGGVSVAIVGGLLAGSYASTPSVSLAFPAGWGILLGIAGVAVGVGIVLCTAAIHFQPSRHLVGGAAIVLLALVSVIFASGGLLVGFALAFLGGLWLFAWKPPVPNPIDTTISNREPIP